MFIKTVIVLFLALCASQSQSQSQEDCKSICERASIKDCQSDSFNDMNYYDEAYKVETDPALLKSVLNEIIRRKIKMYPYNSNETLNILKVVDEDLSNPDYVVLFYTGELVLKSSTGENSTRVPWDKEHVWAKSYGFNNSSLNAYKDLHNLRPCNIKVNREFKNNRLFKKEGDEFCILPYGTEGKCDSLACSTSDTIEPPHKYKGDSARIVFYMDLMYHKDLGLQVVNNPIRTGQSITTSKFGYKDDLYVWSMEDGVDENEKQRNKKLYCIQKNRNPFIDHPEWIRVIYGDGKLVRDTSKGKIIGVYTFLFVSFFILFAVASYGVISRYCCVNRKTNYVEIVN